MNKACTWAAVAAALAMHGMAQAQSSVTVYGNIDTGLTWLSHASGTARVKVSDGYLSPSQLGFKGQEDLGGGVYAVFNLLSGFDAGTGSTGSAPLFSRNAYVGLEGRFGSLTVGRQWDFNDDWLIGSVFKGGWTSGSIFHLSEFDANSDLFNNTVKYVSPDHGGFRAGILYGLGETAGSASAGRLVNLGAKYGAGRFYAAASYFHETERGASGNANRLSTIGASYDLGPAKLRGGYSDSRIGGPGSYATGSYALKQHARVIGAGVDYPAAAMLMLSGDILLRKNMTLSNSSRTLRFMATYSLSKRTALIANIAALNNDDGSMEVLDGAPLANQSQTGVGLIIRHAF